MKTLWEKIDFKTLTIIVLIIVIFLMRACSGDIDGEGKKEIIKIDGKKYEVIKRVVDTVYQPVVQTVYKEGKTIYKEVPIYISVPPVVDTFGVLKDYYAKYVYKDTLKLEDSLGYISVTDTIFQNKVLARVWKSFVNKITVKETVFVKDLPKVQVFAGGRLGVDKATIINFAGPELIIKDKKDRMYSIGIGYNNSKTVTFSVGMYWKIKLKKN